MQARGEGLHLENYRGELKLLAESYLDGKYPARLDASDLAQETLLKAWRDRKQCMGTSEDEIAAWLRSILAHTIANATRDPHRDKRDVRLERSIDVALERSSVLLKNWLAAEISSPSAKLRRHELMSQLAEAIRRIPESQRDAVVMRHWRGLSLDEIAARMDRRREAVAMLIHRGVGRLRAEIREKEG